MGYFVQYHEDNKDKLLKDCVACGKCVKECRVMEYVETDVSPSDIQRGILDFLADRAPLTEISEKKAKICMRCYGCLDVKCQIGINSITINELVKEKLDITYEKKKSQSFFPDFHTLLDEKVTKEEFHKITTPRRKSDAKTLFFPGCNVYKLPDILLDALFVMDAIGEEYSFMPGIENCCGMAASKAGNNPIMDETAERFVQMIKELGVSEVILWCPACASHMDRWAEYFNTIGCKFVPFGKYVERNLDKLDLSEAESFKITYHEPCKCAYMDIDLGVRTILSSIPGTTLVEMEHNGSDTMCCGNNAILSYPEIGIKIGLSRMTEAEATGAEIMINVCHSCHGSLVKTREKANNCSFTVENYATYIRRALD